MSTVDRSRHTQNAFRFAFHVLLFALPLLAAFPLWGPGMVNTRGGGDSPFLLWRTLELAENLRQGHVPPRWMAHAAYDLGYPFFNHYAALPFYLSGGLTALGLSPLLAIQATQTLGFVLAALTMALWMGRIYRSRPAVLLAVAAYSFAPFHLVNVYVRGDSLSEFYAFVWYPLILWALDRAAERATWRRVAVAALAYGALVLTHNVSALIFAPFALLYVGIRRFADSPIRQQSKKVSAQEVGQQAAPKSKIQNLKSILFPFLLAFLLTAWFWIPAIGETGYGQLGPEFTEGYFHYENHFRGIDLVQSTLRFDYGIAPEVGEAGPFAMGLVQAVLALLGAGVLVWQLGTSRIQNLESKIFLLFGLLLSTFMITPLSRLLWAHLPLLATTQFPWRFLSVQALFTAAVTGAIANRPIPKSANPQSQNPKPKIQNLAVVFLCLIIVLAAMGALHPDRLFITAGDVTWDRLLLYESFTGNIGTTIRYEYLPREVVPRLYISEAVVDGVSAALPIAEGGAPLTAVLLERRPTRQVWRVTLTEPVSVVFPLHWWPGWQVKVDGAPTAAYPLTGSGRLAVELGAGEHEVVLRLWNTPLRTAATALSAMTVLALALLLWWEGGPFGAGLSTSGAIIGLALALSLLLPALVTALSASPPAAPATFFDFNQLPYPHRGPVEFAERARLVRVDAPTSAALGETLSVSLDWQLLTAEPLTVTLRLVSPAAPRHGVSYTLAETNAPLAPAQSLSLALPADLARGLYLLEVRVHGATGEHFGRTPQGAGMGPLYAGAVRVEAGPAPDAPVLAQFRDLTLHVIEAEQPDPTTLRLKLGWSTPGTPRNWSLSLRLLAADGRQLSQIDLQPGYGYLPTTLWRPGELVTDYPLLPLPEGLAPGGYTLRVIPYLEATMETGGEADLPLTLTGVTLRDPHDTCCEWERRETQTLCQAGGLALTDLSLPEALREGEGLSFTAEWHALERPEHDFNVRWEARTLAGEVLAGAEGPVAAGSRTSAWPRHTWVRSPVSLALPPLLEAGPLRLRVTLLAGGERVASCELESEIAVARRPRSFEVPDLPYPQAATFGEVLALLGYEYAHGEEQLSVTLWWQAEQAPTEDYKRFVHLYAEGTGAVVVQEDAMPRAWSYPTSWWRAGEVVSETVHLELTGVPPGDYRVAVGWYLPATGVRLPTGSPEDRIVLRALALHQR